MDTLKTDKKDKKKWVARVVPVIIVVGISNNLDYINNKYIR